jgi:hypothetical protein
MASLISMHAMACEGYLLQLLSFRNNSCISTQRNGRPTALKIDLGEDVRDLFMSDGIFKVGFVCRQSIREEFPLKLPAPHTWCLKSLPFRILRQYSRICEWAMFLLYDMNVRNLTQSRRRGRCICRDALFAWDSHHQLRPKVGCVWPILLWPTCWRRSAQRSRAIQLWCHSVQRVCPIR